MPNLDDYKNLTMEALGGSLLSQKAASAKRRRKSGKRDEKINKIIAVLLGTQAIFKTALKDRILEGDDLDLVQKMSDSSAVTEMQALSQVYSGLDEEFLMADNAWELYEQFLKLTELEQDIFFGLFIRRQTNHQGLERNDSLEKQISSQNKVNS